MITRKIVSFSCKKEVLVKIEELQKILGANSSSEVIRFAVNRLYEARKKINSNM